ncbi:hypothetical protein EJ04DRAFT_589366 [Polyplosphaeria fusca]|uniref:Uncharacterized protein n=1 Tax=Polyplosphaeria fusca TaxID=682080 RepID=A0A9P4QR17_9PLEO|nr:hypothetical protein EJ04DRAFT_589366 [Polyplosphaeria fusca]
MAPPTLATLPYDIKVEILKELLVCDRPIEIFRAHPRVLRRRPSSYRPLSSPKTKLHPGILQTPKSFYEDASYILYHMNSFHVMAFTIGQGFLKARWESLSWLKSLKLCNLRVITSLTMDVSLEEVPDEFDDCKRFERPVTQYAKSIAQNTQRFYQGTVQYYAPAIMPIDYVVHEVAIFQALAYIKPSTSLTLNDQVPYTMKLYLSLVIAVPVRGWILQVAHDYVQPALTDLVKEMDDMTRSIQERNGKDYTVPYLGQYDPIQGKFDDKIDMDVARNERLCRRIILDTSTGPHASARIKPVEQLVSALDVLKEEADFLMRDQLWPPVDYYEKQLDFDLRRFEFLVVFWEQLRSLGIFVPREEEGN